MRPPCRWSGEVATDLSDFIRDGEGGVLVDSDREMVAALVGMAIDRTHESVPRSSSLEMFSWPAVVQRHLALYEGGGRGQPAAAGDVGVVTAAFQDSEPDLLSVSALSPESALAKVQDVAVVHGRRWRNPLTRRLPWWGEVLIAVGFYWLYDFVQALTQSDAHKALAHGHDIVIAEKRLHIWAEPEINRWASGHHTLSLVAGYDYGLAHAW